MLSLDQMSDQSSAIVHGKVVASRMEWNSTHTSIVTIYTVKASRYLKGGLGDTFELTELGGQVGNLSMNADGVPRFTAGEEVVLFVWTDGIYHLNQAIGFEQGVFRVRTEAASGMKYVNRNVPLVPAGRLVSSERATGYQQSRELSSFLGQVSASVSRVAQERKAGVRQ
jgi:hypothetical protein